MFLPEGQAVLIRFPIYGKAYGTSGEHPDLCYSTDVVLMMHAGKYKSL